MPQTYRDTIYLVDPRPSALTDDDYERLLAFRDGLRRFLHWSEQQARAAGLSPAQHQLLLAVRGDRTPGGPTIGDVAAHLMCKHHSAVELVDRAQAADLVERRVDAHDQRIVRLALTRHGARCLRTLSEQHLDELERLHPRLAPMWAGLPER
jgi:DNA-binding MarR family transcriptional regulator